MTILVATLAFFLILFVVALPTRKRIQRENQARFVRRYRDFKLYAVKHYHPAFRSGGSQAHLSYEEIRSKYDVTACYDQLR